MPDYEWIHGNILVYKYDPHVFGPELQAFNASMKTVESEVQRGLYAVEEQTERFTLYRSDVMIEPFMLVLRLDRFEIVFILKTDEAVADWKRKYLFASKAGLEKAFLPEKPAAPEHISIPMNLKKLR